MSDKEMSEAEYQESLEYLKGLGIDYTDLVSKSPVALYAVSTICQLAPPKQDVFKNIASWVVAESEEGAIAQAQNKKRIVAALGCKPLQVQSTCVLIPQVVINELAKASMVNH